MKVPCVIVGGRLLTCPAVKEEPVTKKEVNWSKPKNNGKNHYLVVKPYEKKVFEQIENNGIEYLPGEFAYEANDVYSLTKLHPDTLLAYAACGKIYGFWGGDGKFYVDLKTIEVFHRRIGK